MKILCPNCKTDEFDPDPYGDEQYYYCRKCKAETRVFTDGESILTQSQKDFLES